MLYRGILCCIGVCVVMYRCGYIVIYSEIIIGMFRYIIIIIYDVPTIVFLRGASSLLISVQ